MGEVMQKMEAGSELNVINKDFTPKKSMKEIASRVQSPSSILTHKQCPRKYYYQYVLKLPGKENIHLVRGKIAHTVLEKFFEINTDNMNPENYVEYMTHYVKNLFTALWNKNRKKIITLGLTEDKIVFYYEETIMMLANWLNNFLVRLRGELEGKTVKEAFEKLKPIALEQGVKCEEHMVRGFIDYIEEYQDTKGENKIALMDYKTSKSSKMTDNYKLQLAIYALLYEQKHGSKPHRVGIVFLKSGKEVCLDVDQELVDFAKFEIEQIHFATQTKDIKEYPMKPSPLCRWSTGQCDFYQQCFPNGGHRDHF